ncbi:MAG: purine-binding chemotaxis protein CheW [Deltaproteobacteria bacterium]|nr:purine-binding chemotaxis protein CheW [Deltaproteobacteria bacterium]
MDKEKELLQEEFLEDEDEDTQKDKFLTFQVGKEDYGIEIRHVTEIIGIQKITAVPDMPEFVKGVINLRGKVIPVLDMRKRFVLEEREYDERTCIVVVNVSGGAVGLVVDSVNEVADIPQEQIEPAPEINEDNKNLMVQGLGKVGEEVKILLDVDRLIHAAMAA